MRRFIKTGWFKALVVILVFFICGGIAGVVSKDKTSPFSTAVGAVVEPLQRATSFVGNGFKTLSSKVKNFKNDEKKIKELQNKIDKYQKELVEFENTKQKVELYEKFWDIKDEHKDFKIQPAIVIGRDVANVYSSIVINKGKVDGVKKSDPVICGNGQLVGVVSKVGGTYSVISTIFDSAVKISSYEIKTRETGFSTTTAKLSENNLCRLSGLNKNTAISTGGIVCTSGEGTVYPRDLIIGTVKEVRDDKRDISSYAIIVPDFDISRLENVLVVTEFDGQGTSMMGE